MDFINLMNMHCLFFIFFICIRNLPPSVCFRDDNLKVADIRQIKDCPERVNSTSHVISHEPGVSLTAPLSWGVSDVKIGWLTPLSR